jgi:hypothetical protein
MEACGQLEAGILIVFRTLTLRAALAALAGLVFLSAAGQPARASGPIETNVFAVQGVEVDVTSTDAASAKNQALMDVQVKAFQELAARLGSPELAAEVREKFKPEDIAPYLRSLSIEYETSAPGRYIGRFTVRFLPDKMQKFFQSYGIRVPTQQAEPVLVVPVFRGPDGNLLWEDNPWRKAWIDLKGEQGLVPVIVPLGDLEDTQALSVNDVLNGDSIRLEALRKRYGAPSLLVAQAQPADGGGLHVYIEGETRLGKVAVNKIYKPEEGSADTPETRAVNAFQQLLFKAYKERVQKVAEEKTVQNADGSRSLAVAVPFTSPREWNAIRSRILTTPNVIGVDLSSLNADGAVIRLIFVRSVEELQGNMQAAGLTLAQSGSTWIIQPM